MRTMGKKLGFHSVEFLEPGIRGFKILICLLQFGRAFLNFRFQSDIQCFNFVIGQGRIQCNGQLMYDSGEQVLLDNRKWLHLMVTRHEDTQRLMLTDQGHRHSTVELSLGEELTSRGMRLIGDIKEKKITLPLIIAMKNAKTSEKKNIIKMLKKGAGGKDVQTVITFSMENGGLSGAKESMEHYAVNAKKNLDIFSESIEKENAYKFVDYVIGRNK